jgi:aspartate dehydrogenase
LVDVTMKLALLGAGGIARTVAAAVLDGRLAGVQVAAVAGRSAASASAAALAARLGARVVAAEDLPSTGCGWVLEAAGGAAAREHLPAIWASGVSTVVLSLGALLDPRLEAAWREAQARGVRVVLPSGAIAGLDGVRAMAAVGDLRRASITSTKAPAGLRGAPYLLHHGIELPDDRAVTVFEGTAREAALGFPANVNVAVALALAGLGPDATAVVVRSDPAARRSLHRIEAEGDAVRLVVEVASSPSPDNPRTSLLAGASAVAALGEIQRGG